MSYQSTTHSSSRGFTLVELVVVILIILLLVAMLLPFSRTAGGAAKRLLCSNNLKQLAVAMHNYHNTYKCLPPAYTVDAAGNRLHSWRTLLLPFLEQEALYKKIDLTKPWNDPVNRAVAGKHPPPMFVCPADKQRTQTHYLVIVDPEGCFPGEKSVAFSEVTDGLANTLLIVEVPQDNGVDWMSPYDGDWSLLSSINEKSKLNHYGMTNAAMADMSISPLAADSELSVRRGMITISAGDTPNEDDEQ